MHWINAVINKWYLVLKLPTKKEVANVRGNQETFTHVEEKFLLLDH
jgi:hypothetical protein